MRYNNCDLKTSTWKEAWCITLHVLASGLCHSFWCTNGSCYPSRPCSALLVPADGRCMCLTPPRAWREFHWKKGVGKTDSDRLKLENGQDRPIFKHHGTKPRQRRKRQMWMRIPMMLVRMGHLAFQMDELNQPPKWIGHVQCTVAAKGQNAGTAFWRERYSMTFFHSCTYYLFKESHALLTLSKLPWGHTWMIRVFCPMEHICVWMAWREQAIGKPPSAKIQTIWIGWLNGWWLPVRGSSTKSNTVVVAWMQWFVGRGASLWIFGSLPLKMNRWKLYLPIVVSMLASL